jgi:hypothetical protein
MFPEVVCFLASCPSAITIMTKTSGEPAKPHTPGPNTCVSKHSRNSIGQQLSTGSAPADETAQDLNVLMSG